MKPRIRPRATVLTRRIGHLNAHGYISYVSRARKGANVGVASSEQSVNQLQTRHASSSSSSFNPFSSFFSRQTPRPSSDRFIAREDFLAAVKTQKIDDIKTAYDSICRSTPMSSSSFPLSSEDLLSAMELCTSSSSPSSLTLLKTIYLDLPKRGIQRQGPHYSSMISGLIFADRPDEAFAMIKRLDGKVKGLKVGWMGLLSSAVRCESESVEEIAKTIKQKRPFRSKEITYLLRDLKFSLNNPARERTLDGAKMRLEEILSETKNDTEPISLESEAELVSIYSSFGDEQSLNLAEQIVKSWSRNESNQEFSSAQQWNALADLMIAKDDNNGVECLLRGMKALGTLVPPRKAVEYSAIKNLERRIASKSDVTTVDVISAIEAVEDLSGSQATPRTWSEVLRYLISKVPDSLLTALQAYEIAKDRGVPTDLQLARALIFPLCSSFRPHLDSAVKVYNDYVPNPKDTPRVRAQSLALYQALLIACSKVATPAATSIAIRLLNDMRQRQLDFTPSIVTSLIILLINTAPDHKTAFNFYAHFHALSRYGLVKESYDVIIPAFLNLSTDKSPFPPSNLYIEMIRDMQRAGYRPASSLITSLLTNYGAQARFSRKSSSDPNVRQQKIDSISQSIAELHSAIKLDPLVDIDIPLLTALMDAYGRVGDISEALAVWEEIVERRPREDQSIVQQLYSPSLNVVLDVCGHSNLPSRARKAWAWAGRWGFREDMRNWEAWIECLCRNNLMEEAFATVLEMRDGKIGPRSGDKPGREMISLLLKFSWRSKEDYKWVKRRVEGEFPELWEELRGIVETRSSTKQEAQEEL